MEDIIKLKPIGKLTELEIIELSEITKKKDIMKHIGSGETWSLDKIRSFVKDESKDLNKKYKKYWSFCIYLSRKITI